MTALVRTQFQTPLGPMVAAGTDQGVCLLEFLDGAFHDGPKPGDAPPDLPDALAGGPRPAPLEQLESELAAYFAGTLRTFQAPLLTDGTAWEREVWDALRRVPYARTCSYAHLAGALGRPGAARAVGLANARNRIAVVIPCHRVINSAGGLHGYAGGLERKRWLLEHEARAAGRGTLFG